MKLFLSSDGFLTRTQFKQLVGKEYKDANVGLIMNATDWMKSSEKKTRLDEVRERFERIDIKPELLDLRRFYNKTPESLLKKLQQYDL
ncbi:MAG: hypothetical protein ABH880_01415, partial [Patescibacteria group bacterium]